MIVICFLKKLVDKRNDKVKFDIIPKTNEDYMSVTLGCKRFVDSYQFLSSSSDSLVKTSADNSHKTLEDLEEIVNNDEILNIVTETKKLIKEDRYSNDSIEDLKKDYPGKKIRRSFT